MSDSLYKALKRQEASVDNKKHENMAIRLMKNYVTEDNQKDFYDKLATHLNNTFINQEK